MHNLTGMQSQQNLTMNFLLLQKAGELTSQIIEKSKWAVFFVPILAIIERYFFSDWEFLFYLLIAMALDTVLGLGLAIWNKRISPQGFGSIFVKIIVYGSVLIIGHGVTSVTINGSTIVGAQYFTMLCYASIYFKEVLSIIRNLGKVNKNLVPKWILKRLEGFDETGDINKLMAKKEEEEGS